MAWLIHLTLLLALALLFHRKALFDPDYTFPFDFRSLHVPLASYIAESFSRGEIPLWDPFTYCGRPLFANIQAQLFYPPLFVALLLNNLGGMTSVTNVLEWLVALHVFAAGAGTFVLLEYLGLPRPSALTGAILFELGCFFCSQIQHLGAAFGAAWLPLAWLFSLRITRSDFTGHRSWFSFCGLAVCIAMPILAGLPQVAFAVGTSSVLLGLIQIFLYRGRFQKLVWIVTGACFGVALSAVQVIPTYELTMRSVARYRTDWLKAGGGLKLEALTSLILPDHYHQLSFTNFSGPADPTFLVLYGGLTGLVLVLIGIASKATSHRVFAALLLLSAFAMFGDSTRPGAALLQLLPVSVRVGIHPEFFLCAFSLAFAVAGAIGHSRLPIGKLLAYGIAAAVAADLFLVGSNRPINTSSLLEEPGVTPTSFNGSRAVVSYLRSGTAAHSPQSRIDTIDTSYDWTETATLTHLPSANGVDPLALSSSIELRLAFCHGNRSGWFYEVENLRSPVLNLANVEFLLSRAPVSSEKLAGSLYAEDRTIGGFHLYRNRVMLPRFFTVDRIRRAAFHEQALAMLYDPAFQPQSEVIVEESFPAGSGSAGHGSVSVIRYDPHYVKLDVAAAGPAVLVAAETDYPGWEAFVDGVQTRISTVDIAFRGLALNAGRHTVEMRFRPKSLYYGSAITLVAIAIAACLCAMDLRRSPETPSVEPAKSS